MNIKQKMRAGGRRLGKHTAFLLAIVLATVVGGASTALVMAAIPDASGAVHACYLTSGTSKGSVRIIDPANGDTCTDQESPLDWNANGSQSAFAFLNDDGTLNTSLSKNIDSVELVTDPITNIMDACFEVSFQPKAGFANEDLAANFNTTTQTADIANTSSQATTNVSRVCGSGYNALASAGDVAAGIRYSDYEFTFYN